MTDEEDVWMSDGVDEDERAFLTSQDPSAFGLALTYQGGVEGGYHVRNRPGERQRSTVSAFQAGSRRKPAFTVSCQAKAIVHGALAGKLGKRATLVVYELSFLSRKGIRIKEADVRLEFKGASENSQFPEVVAIRPDGVFKMGETLETLTSNTLLSFNLSPGLAGVDAGVTLSEERSKSKDKKHYTTLIGENQPDLDFGYHASPRFRLEENDSQKSGIPSRVTIAALLERKDDEDFALIPYIEVSPSFKFSTLLSTFRSSDDPVIFSVKEAPVNHLSPSVSIDSNNLGLVDLDYLWNCTMFNSYGDAIKTVPGTEPKTENESGLGC